MNDRDRIQKVSSGYVRDGSRDRLFDELSDNINNNLDVLRVIYVFSFGLGYNKLAELYTPKNNLINVYWFVVAVGSVLLVFLSIRFFWAIGNLRRYLLHQLKNNIKNVDMDDPKKSIKKLLEPVLKRTMFLDVPILMLHSFLFLLLCVYYVDLANNWQVQEKRFYSSSVFVHMYCALLYINAFWLYLLRDQGDENEPEHSWMQNNFVAASLCLLAFPILLFFGCKILALAVAIFIFYVNSFFDFNKCYDAYMLKPHG